MGPVDRNLKNPVGHSCMRSLRTSWFTVNSARCRDLISAHELKVLHCKNALLCIGSYLRNVFFVGLLGKLFCFEVTRFYVSYIIKLVHIKPKLFARLLFL